MKKKVFGRKLSMERDSRRALFRALTLSLVTYGKIKTTKAKAMAVAPFVEKVLKKAILANDDSKRRFISSLLANDRKLSEMLFGKINKEFSPKVRLTSFVPLPERKGDNAKMVILKVVEGVFLTEKPVDKTTTKKSKTDKSDKSKKSSKDKK